MFKSRALFAAIALIFSLQAFADTNTMTNGTNGPSANPTPTGEVDITPCKNIATACTTAGFVRKGTPGKLFWKDCMKPVLLGQNVNGVTIDPNDVTACKQVKMDKMQKELQDFQQSTPSTTSME